MHVSKENLASTAFHVYSWQKMEMMLVLFFNLCRAFDNVPHQAL